MLEVANIFLESQDIARDNPAERSGMTTRAFHNCKNTIVREAKQCDEIMGMDLFLST
ncbi:MAG: hypothetical protein ACFFD2_14415 [Promethearchaeota archaeon]